MRALFHSKCRNLEVDAFFLGNQGAIQHKSVDRADILANDAQRNQLHRTQKKQAENNRSQTYSEALPEDKFIREVKHP